MKKGIIKLIIMFVTLILCATVVEAAGNSYSVTMAINKNTIEAGEKLEITVSLSDLKINTGDKGLGAFQGKIEYDQDIFEYVSIKGLNSWDTPIYNSGAFVTTTSTGEVIKKGEAVFKVTLKAKEKIEKEKTTIKIKNITASSGVETISTTSVSKTIQLKRNNNEEKKETNTTNTTTSTSKGTSSKKPAVSADKTVANKKIPYAGTSLVIVYMILSAIALIVISGIIIACIRR